jgi:hypothetical protein
MNDLTFGATLLSCFAMLVTAVIIEITSAPERSGAVVSRPAPVVGHAAKTATKDCSTVALAQANTHR